MTVIMPVYITNDELLNLTKEAISSLGTVILIIIDNDSTLGGGYLRSIANIYIKNDSNLGYAKAVNQGLRLAKDQYVAIANNDIRVSPNWKEVCTDILNNHPKVYSVHPRMTDYDIPFRYGFNTVPTGKERWCTSSFFVMRRGKYYDESFLNSYDDWDFWYRVRKGGHQTCYTDLCCYQHHHSSTQQIIPEREANNQRNREYFKKKHGEYAEDLFAKQFPDQVIQEYWKGFEI